MTTDGPRRYRVYLTGMASTSTEVTVDPAEAKDGRDLKELALEKAYQHVPASLCWQCAKYLDLPGEWHAGAWTQEPENLDTNVEEL